MALLFVVLMMLAPLLHSVLLRLQLLLLQFPCRGSRRLFVRRLA